MKARKKEQISPRTLRKASRHRNQYPATRAAAAGSREPTRTGYVIPGVSCKEYETFYEYIDSQQSTDKIRHEKKTRSYRVLGGKGFAVLEVEGKQTSVVLVTGTELHVSPGTSCTISTTSTDTVDLLVILSSKYSARMETLETFDTKSSLDSSNLGDVTAQDLIRNLPTIPIPRRRGSKAAEQQKQLAMERGRLVSKPAETGHVVNDASFKPNLSPTHGMDLPGEPG